MEDREWASWATGMEEGSGAAQPRGRQWSLSGKWNHRGSVQQELELQKGCSQGSKEREKYPDFFLPLLPISPTGQT